MNFRSIVLAATVLLPGALHAQTVASALPAAITPGTQGAPSMDRVERHVADLKRRLMITPAQQPQWDTFTAVMRQNAKHMETLYSDRAAHAATLSATDDMRTYAELARAHADDLQKLVPSFDALYATMSAEQKANADKVFQQFQGRGERRGRPARN